MAQSKIEDKAIVQITFTCKKQEAYAFAQFLQRAQYDDFGKRSFDDDDATRVLNAAEAIQIALHDAGFKPR